MSDLMVEARGVTKDFKISRGLFRGKEVLRAVDKVSLNVNRGETLAVVGESGCGKSTLGRVVAGVHGASDGKVLFRGQDVANLEGNEAREAALKIQMIFQDPYSSLNPRMTIGNSVLMEARS